MKAALMREYHAPLEFVERPVPEPSRPTDVLIRIGGAGVCATDLHALEGLMEPAGVTLPRVLGHENAGWVEEVGDAVTTVAAGRRRARLPAAQLRPLRPVPARDRHALHPPRVHGTDRRRRVRRVRRRSGALARGAARRASSRSRSPPMPMPGSRPTTPSGGWRISPRPARRPSWSVSAGSATSRCS